MFQGESSEDIVKFEIIKFLFHKLEPQSFKEIEEHNSASRNTTKKYLEMLKDEGIVEQSMKGRHPYFLTSDGKRLAEKEFQKQKLKQQIDELSEEQIKSLYDFVNEVLMKAVTLTVDNAMLEMIFEKFREGKITDDKIDKVLEAKDKTVNELKNRKFFTDEEINKMVYSKPSSKEDIEKLTKARITWFEKWFGD